MKKWIVLTVALLLAAAIQMLYYVPHLPPVIASHYGAGMAANGWMKTGQFFTTYFVTMCLVSLVFLGLSALLPRWPDSVINLPNKSYWLSPERRQRTLARLQDIIGALGALTLLFLLALNQLVIVTNINHSDHLPEATFVTMLLAYVGLVIAVSVYMLQHFHSVQPRQKTPVERGNPHV
jgi:uncharacterized membrane protein